MRTKKSKIKSYFYFLKLIFCSVKNDDEINRLEKKLLGDKNWIMKGEVVAKNRPINSLVE